MDFADGDHPEELLGSSTLPYPESLSPPPTPPRDVIESNRPDKSCAMAIKQRVNARPTEHTEPMPKPILFGLLNNGFSLDEKLQCAAHIVHRNALPARTARHIGIESP